MGGSRAAGLPQHEKDESGHPGDRSSAVYQDDGNGLYLRIAQKYEDRYVEQVDALAEVAGLS